MFTQALRQVRKNLALKLFSVLLAVGLWVYVINTEDPVRKDSVDRPVETLSVPEGLAVVRIRPERVRVQLEGRVSSLQPAALSQLRVVADLSEAVAGRNTLALRVVGVPERVSPPDIDRPNVHVWLDQEFGKALRVDAVLGGKPAKGAAVLGKPTVRPSVAAVSGPEGAVERVAQVVARVDVEGLSERKSVSAEVEALDARGMPVTGVSLEPPKVVVVVPVTASTTKRVRVRPRIGRAPEGYKAADVRTDPQTVLVKGTEQAIARLAEISTEWQGIAKQRAATTTYRVPLAFPSGVWPAEDVRSAEVQVTITPVAAPPPPTPATPPEDAAGGPHEDAPEPPAPSAQGTGAEGPAGADQAGAPATEAGADDAERVAPTDAGGDTRPAAPAVPDDGGAKATPRSHPSGGDSPRGARPKAAEPPKGQPKGRPDAGGDPARGTETGRGAPSKAKSRAAGGTRPNAGTVDGPGRPKGR